MIGKGMIKTKAFTMTDIDGSKYKISVDYEQDGDIVAIIIKGDCKDLLDYRAEMRIIDAFNGVMENEKI